MDHNNITLFQDIKSISELKEAAIARITGGETDPLKAYTTMSKYLKIIDEVMRDKAVKDTVIDYVERRGERGEVNTRECQVRVVESGVKYDYSECGHMKLDELYERRKELDAAIKSEEAFVKGLREPMTVVDEETGEVNRIYPPSKSSTTTVRVIFKNR